MSRLMHQLFIGVQPEPEEPVYFVFEDGDQVVFENEDKLIDQ